jgi:GNAT superfamily N-acetyltransferase
MADDLAARAEFGEAGAYARLVDSAPAALRDAHGLVCQRFGRAHAFAARDAGVSLMLNRVVGLGIADTADDTQLDAIDALYRAHGVQAYAVELAPAAQPADLAERLRARGFMPFKQLTLMARAVEPLSVPDAAHAVRRAGPADRAEFARLACGHFGLGPLYEGLVQASFDDPAWQHWLACDGDTPVATAMTCVDGDYAWIGWVGTIEPYRGRGIQAALTAAQMQAAQAAGARWVTLETALAARRQPGPSQRNYLRLGWTALYNRTVYLRRLPP